MRLSTLLGRYVKYIKRLSRNHNSFNLTIILSLLITFFSAAIIFKLSAKIPRNPEQQYSGHADPLLDCRKRGGLQCLSGFCCDQLDGYCKLTTLPNNCNISIPSPVPQSPAPTPSASPFTDWISYCHGGAHANDIAYDMPACDGEKYNCWSNPERCVVSETVVLPPTDDYPYEYAMCCYYIYNCDNPNRICRAGTGNCCSNAGANSSPIVPSPRKSSPLPYHGCSEGCEITTSSCERLGKNFCGNIWILNLCCIK